MRVTQFLVLTLLAAVATFSDSTVMASDTHTAKIAAKLLKEVQKDPSVEADIMVQLESPDEVMHRVCGSDGDAPQTRAQKTTCMVNNLQDFADQSQQEVKDLLAQHKSEYADAMFFWINNSVAVKKCKGSLVLALSALDTVLKIRPEQIFHTTGDTGTTHAADTDASQSTTTFGLNVIH